MLAIADAKIQESSAGTADKADDMRLEGVQIYADKPNQAWSFLRVFLSGHSCDLAVIRFQTVQLGVEMSILMRACTGNTFGISKVLFRTLISISYRFA